MEVWIAVIPAIYVKPFDLDYYPTDFPPFLPFIMQLKYEIGKKKEYPRIWVYQRGRFFIASDDYPQYHAYLESECPFIVGIVLGKPDHPAVSKVSGPFRYGQET